MLDQINKDNLPKHIAIIMDGNGRWAKKQGMNRLFGHQNALTAIRESSQAASDLGVMAVTLYAFSTENWNRPKLEVDGLMHLLVRTLKKELPFFMANNVQFKAIGNLKDLPKSAFETLQSVIDATQENTGLVLTFCLSYGSREELVSTIKSIAGHVAIGNLSVDDINESTINQYLYTANLPDVDLLIRTSGEQRISNFLLWQIAYAELYFTEVLWPDFRKEDLYEAILVYQGRERRFGKTSEQITGK